MRACELMAGRTDVESALLARGAVAMILLSIMIVGAGFTAIEGSSRNENRGQSVLTLTVEYDG